MYFYVQAHEVWCDFVLSVIDPPSICPYYFFFFLFLLFLSNRKSSTVPDSVAMTMLARKGPSPVIQVTVKQTETDPGLIGVVCDLNINACITLELTCMMS